MNPRWIILVVLAHLTPGCAGPAIATSDDGWEVEPVPYVDIHDTSLEGEALLQRPVSAMLLSNGNVVVADIHAAVVVWFDSAGRKLRAYGRRGRGPGEFADVRWIGHCSADDSLFVWDYTRRTIIVLDSAGTFAREYRPERRPHQFACSRSGKFLVSDISASYVEPGPDGPSMMTDAWLADSEGVEVGFVGAIPLAENRPLGKVTRFAVANDRMYIGTADSAWIDVYDLAGRRTGLLAVGVPPRAPTKANHEIAIERTLAPLSRPVREHFLPILSEIPLPALLPAYADLFVDPDDLLWVVLSAPGDGETRLRALRQSGEIVGDVRIPLDLTIYEVGRDHILGAYDDALGFPHVVAFRLDRH